MGGRTAAADQAPARRRTCVGCRRVADPHDLVRIVREPTGTVSVGSGPGRGAWLCGPPSTERCFERAVRRRALERALRVRVPPEELAALRAKLLEMSADGDERE
ncbi:MAG TPA: YlxR family protein [Acidimicrobiia bacterium]|nr:YlxR family protein [Acidimicrobiia bacterium]